MKLQKSQTVFMIFYLMFRTLIEFLIILFVITAGPISLFILLPVMSLGIIGYNYQIHIQKQNQKHVKFTYIFNMGYSILIAVIGRLYFTEGDLMVDMSPRFYALGGVLCLLEILKYIVLEKGSKNLQKD